MNTIDYIIDEYGLCDQAGYTPGKPCDRVIEIPHLTRDKFASLLKDLKLDMGAEIGVEAGIYSETLLKANFNLLLHCVDSWKAYEGYRDHATQDKMDELYKITQERLQTYNRVFFHKGFSMDMVKKFNDNSLDFVYIDGNHEFRQVVDDVSEWTKKVRPGGIVAGHDYIKRKDPGYLMHVVPAIHGYCEAYDIKPLFIMGKRDDVDRDSIRSWFFVKSYPSPIRSGSGNKALT